MSTADRNKLTKKYRCEIRRVLTLLKHFSMCRSATRGESAMPHVTQNTFNSASSSTSAFWPVHAHTCDTCTHARIKSTCWESQRIQPGDASVCKTAMLICAARHIPNMTLSQSRVTFPKNIAQNNVTVLSLFSSLVRCRLTRRTPRSLDWPNAESTSAQERIRRFTHRPQSLSWGSSSPLTFESATLDPIKLGYNKPVCQQYSLCNRADCYAKLSFLPSGGQNHGQYSLHWLIGDGQAEWPWKI